MTTGGRVAELDVALLGAPATSGRIAELDAAVLGAPDTAAQIAEVDVAMLAYIGPCATRRCMIWKITRRDGEVFAYTSLDADIAYCGVTYRTCKSLTASSTEQASELKSVGNTELRGMLDDAAIAEADLYAGLFDDAYVEVAVIPWDGPDEAAPFFVAAGWTGRVTREEYAFTAEVLGPGARLLQAALVDFYQPGCRWDFGVLDADGIGCPVDVEALKVAAVPVTGQKLRSLVFFTAADPGGAIVWNGGRVRWLTGRNAGVVCQVATVDFAAQTLSLWDLAPFPAAAGDTFDLLPGCTKLKTACTDYGAYLSFGGFEDIPGPDALQSNADALFANG